MNPKILFLIRITVMGICFPLSLSAQAPSISYAANQYHFLVGNPITPLVPLDSSRSMFQVKVTTLAGNGNASFLDGPNANASFNLPTGIAVNDSGYVFVSDYKNHRIRKIGLNGMVTTIAGNGTPSFADGQDTSSRIYYPEGLAIDKQGFLLVADKSNHRIRKISPSGYMSTVAGNGNSMYMDGPGAAASFCNPRGIGLDSTGNLLIADWDNNRIRKINAANWVSTLAGSGVSGYADGNSISAKFWLPASVVADQKGNLFVADEGNHRIRKITPGGVVSTWCGNTNWVFRDGWGTIAAFYSPRSLVIDRDNFLYVADKNNHRIRMISPTGFVTTLAGNGLAAYTDSSGNLSSFNKPAGIAIDRAGNLYIADSENNRIRKITFLTKGKYHVSPALPAGLTLDSINGIISGIPFQHTPATNYTITASNSFGSNNFVINLSVSFPSTVEANQIQDWQYYPNPANQLVNIRLELAQTAPVSIELTDLSGRLLKKIYEGQHSPGSMNLEVPTTELAQGFYLLRLSCGNEHRTGRLVINH